MEYYILCACRRLLHCAREPEEGAGSVWSDLDSLSTREREGEKRERGGERRGREKERAEGEREEGERGEALHSIEV